MLKMTDLKGNRSLPKLPARGKTFLLQKDYSPASASDCFNGKTRFISVNDNDRLHLYETKISGEKEEMGSSLPYLLFLHGGGSSGLTWVPVIRQLTKMFTAQFGAVDIRGHGQSSCENEMDLSTETVTEDLFQLVQQLNLGEGECSLILIGHSMGGAFAINLASRLQEEKESTINLKGLIVIDVVEGSALQSLSWMQHILRSRPKEFLTLTSAIEWCVRSGQTKNVDSARVSMPGQLKLVCGTNESSNPLPKIGGGSSPTTCCIREEESEDANSTSATKMQAPVIVHEKYVWRIDLKKTEQFWRGWFEGLSKKFLSIRRPKLLLLAGVDRLDRELMVAQMQGKFEMHVLSSVGHIVHEDAPDRVAEHIALFLARNKITATTTTSSPIPRLFPGV